MEPKFVCLDVGGTQIKAAAIEKNGHLSAPIQYFPARSEENAETILDHFTRIIRQVWEPEAVPEIRLAFPGPFDYEQENRSVEEKIECRGWGNLIPCTVWILAGN